MNLVDGTEPGAAGVLALCDRALALKKGARPRQFPGAVFGGVFFNPSLRTRGSLEAACAKLGVLPMILNPGDDAWAWETRTGVRMDGDAAEHIIEAVRVLSGYANVLGVRCFARSPEEVKTEPVLSAFLEHATVPVVSLESAAFHPLQGLADAATWLAHFGDPRGVPITLTWAPHPKSLPLAVPHQVVLMAAQLGMDVTVAHPEGLDLDPDVLARARAMSRVTVTHDQQAALRGARVVYAKSWSSPGGHAAWTVTEAKLGNADNAGFMHCLPIRRNVVATDGVLDGRSSWVTETAHLRMWTAMAVLESLLAGVA